MYTYTYIYVYKCNVGKEVPILRNAKMYEIQLVVVVILIHNIEIITKKKNKTKNVRS